ncbi:cellulose synthase/poly-beta-1,6-N-acetylglucosamine synthase-like glycosyltransferase [Flavobacterium limicola]|uniref:Cellulose synthase/poly-beta-1,6-N-acetylglucosamine synthase-like glycosyltransferase n=1 Tax=Flavobacterium limicola TaxID=180441 RepID=A0A495S4Q0_9FLAO|nr:glycosyltransferase [Flavobacterium limicola]RKS94571.1 cellulose synthase/poly-beta-1,6-N-acetylglucosamine synthase-like glycosyltransferase [Flavobacterium limicola]
MITIVLYIIIFMYCLAIIVLIYGFTKVNTIEYTGLTPKTKFSIIVPFRNEAENLPILLASLSKLNYPMELFEVILVDDESKESFEVQDLKFKVSIIKNIRVSNSPKKDAIVTAMQIVTTDWIITTDADCVVNENWLFTLDNYIQLHDVSMIASAVTYDCGNSFLHHFQQLDLASLQGATIGSFGINKGFMCNGANFAYTKSFFKKLNGFNGNDSIASGDDVFLLQKAIAKSPEKVHYLKSQNNIVTTKTLDDWKSLFYQRVRWASKTSSYQSTFGKGLGVLVFAGNLVLIVSVGCWVLGVIPFQNIVLLFLLKFLVDTVLIYKANYFLTKTKIQYLILSNLLYPFFSVSVALYSLFGKYEWKGRKF